MLSACTSTSEALFADDVVSVVGPTCAGNALRREIFERVREHIGTVLSAFPCLSASICMYGSVPLYTFLSDSDIDVTIIIASPASPALVEKVCAAIAEHFARLSALVPAIAGLHVVPAEVQVIKLQWLAVPVDITMQQYNACVAYRLLEDVNALMGKGGIFKRAIVLIKAWCLYDAHVLGSQHGNLCSYAVEVMIMYVLNNYYVECLSALDVFKLFIKVFSSFNWTEDILTIFGPISIAKYNFAVIFHLQTNSAVKTQFQWPYQHGAATLLLPSAPAFSSRTLWPALSSSASRGSPSVQFPGAVTSPLRPSISYCGRLE